MGLLIIVLVNVVLCCKILLYKEKVIKFEKVICTLVLVIFNLLSGYFILGQNNDCHQDTRKIQVKEKCIEDTIFYDENVTILYNNK